MQNPGLKFIPVFSTKIWLRFAIGFPSFFLHPSYMIAISIYFCWPIIPGNCITFTWCEISISYTAPINPRSSFRSLFLPSPYVNSQRSKIGPGMCVWAFLWRIWKISTLHVALLRCFPLIPLGPVYCEPEKNEGHFQLITAYDSFQ